MKTIYQKPTTRIVYVSNVSAFALTVSNTNASNDGSRYTNALGREDNAWDEWDED